MPEPAIASARRVGTLDNIAAVPASAQVTVRVAAPCSRFALRLGAADAARLGATGGIDLSLPINRFAGDRWIAARLGPDEWLLLAPDDAEQALPAAWLAAVAETHHALVDIGHRNIAIEVGGRAAAAVLNAGCPLDLDDRRFPVGHATRTLLGKAEIVLLRLPDRDGLPRYRIECWRSFGRYVHGFLEESAREHRIAPN